MKKAALFIILFFGWNMAFAQQNAQTPSTEGQIILMDNYTVTSMFGDIKNNGFQKGIELSSKNKAVYAVDDANVIFYRKKTSRTIKLAGGDYVIMQSKDNQTRYKYSNLTEGDYDKEKYAKGEKIGEAKLIADSYEIGSVTFEMENIPKQQYVNPITILGFNDRFSPSIQDVYFKATDSSIVSLVQTYSPTLVRGGSLFIRCKDRLTQSLKFYTPYSIKVLIDGNENGGIKFDYIQKKGNKLYLSDTNLSYDEIYTNGQEFDFYLLDFTSLPGLVGFQLIVEDYAGNKQTHRKPIRVRPPEIN